MDTNKEVKLPKKSTFRSNVDALIVNPMFWRLITFGTVSLFLMNYLYKWAYFLTDERSYTRNVWPFEYHFFPSATDIERVINKYDYLSHTDMAIMQVIGIANTLFYAMFMCDILTLTLPEAMQSLDLLPFALALIDFAENSCYFAILVYAPDRIAVWDIVGYLTLTKNIFTYGLVVIIALSVITYPIRYCCFRTKKQPKPSTKKDQ